MLVELVLFDDVWGEQFYRHFHILKPVHGSAKVEIPYINPHELYIFCADDTIPQQLGSREVGCSCCEFARLINQIPPAVILTLLGQVFVGDSPQRSLHISPSDLPELYEFCCVREQALNFYLFYLSYCPLVPCSQILYQMLYSKHLL